jgi:hypothetical protein
MHIGLTDRYRAMAHQAHDRERISPGLAKPRAVSVPQKVYDEFGRHPKRGPRFGMIVVNGSHAAELLGAKANRGRFLCASHSDGVVNEPLRKGI